MKLILGRGSPYARLAWVMVLEKNLERRVELEFIQTRITDNPLYSVHPSGRVPCLILDDGTVMEDSALVCAYLDSLDGAPCFAPPTGAALWPYWRREAMARSIWQKINLPNLRENILPSRPRADLVLTKGTQHRIEEASIEDFAVRI